MIANKYIRPVYQTIYSRIKEPRRFIQVLYGPRQAGKTTIANQVCDNLDYPTHYASADSAMSRGLPWIDEQWAVGRLKARDSGSAVLVLDEIQKIPGWSNVVKKLWDEDTRLGVQLRLLILGSSPLLMKRGMDESLAGRFEVVTVPHWSFSEMRDAFGWTLDQYVFFGGYPGAAPLIEDNDRWRAYITDSLIETSISRDILYMARVDKPALLRQLFHLGSEYSGQVLSYTKIMGQLQDSGNATTVAHYLTLLGGAWMLTGLQKYSGSKIRQRGSSPKLQVLNTALMSALSGKTFEQAKADAVYWGRLVESAVGAHLLNSVSGSGMEVYYWREGDREVDFVLSAKKRLAAIEVKSGRKKESLPGMAEFDNKYHPDRILLAGEHGIPVERFLLEPVKNWLEPYSGRYQRYSKVDPKRE